MALPRKTWLGGVLPLVYSLLAGSGASAYTIEAVAGAYPAGHPDQVAVGTSTMDTGTTELFFDTGVITSTFGTLPGEPPTTARGLASARQNPGTVDSFELGVLASSSGSNLIASAGARARIMDRLTVSLPPGSPTATIGVTFRITGFDQDDGGFINGFLASILVGPLTDTRSMSWGAGDLIPDSGSGAIAPLVFSETFTVSDGGLLLLSVGIDARTEGSRTLDFSSTGGVSFELPPGVALISETGLVIVPEPIPVPGLHPLGLGVLAILIVWKAAVLLRFPDSTSLPGGLS